MKRILIYIIALVALHFVPVVGADIGTLHPVEVVLVYKEADQVVIATDTEDIGKGTDGLSALENLKATTPGTVYLDTAEYLLIGEDAQDVAEQLRGCLKKSVKVCKAEKSVKLTDCAQYLSVHGRLPRLKDWKIGDNLPYLQVFEERLLLTGNS